MCFADYLTALTSPRIHSGDSALTYREWESEAIALPKSRKKFQSKDSDMVCEAEQYIPLQTANVCEPNPRSMTQFYPFVYIDKKPESITPGDWIIYSDGSPFQVLPESYFKDSYVPLESSV